MPEQFTRQNPNPEDDGNVKPSQKDAKNNSGSKKKKGNKGKRKGDQPPKETKFGKNDPAWYFTDPDLLKYVGKIPFSRALGSEFTPVTAPMQDQSISHNLPGVMAIRYIPGIGIAKTNTDAVNVAARALYSFVRHENSGSRNYEAVDLMLYILAFDSVAQSISYAQRALNYAGTFSTRNRYLGDALISAMGFDPDDIRGNILNFQGQLQIAINRINSFCVPGVFPFIKRHFMLPSAVYTDSPNYEESQLYLFRPTGYYYYDQTGDNGGSLKYDGYFIGTKGLTVTSIMSAINTQINSMMLSEDIGTMSGDILKAYGKENCYTIGSLTGLINANPIYNENLILQIMNLKAVGSASNADVTQDPATGTLLWNPTFTFMADGDTGDTAQTGDVFSENSLNMPSRELADNPEAIMYATRFTVPVSGVTNNTLTLASCGSEVVESLTIYKYKGAPSSSNLDAMTRRTVLSNHGDSSTFFDDELPFIDAVSKFDYAPIIKLRSHSDIRVVHRFADLRIYTEVTNETLDNLNHVALFGLFNLPKVSVDKTNSRMGSKSAAEAGNQSKQGKSSK